jgi:hypothetical protein
LPVSLKHFANSADWASYLQPGAEVAIFETFTSKDGPAPSPTPRGDGLALDAPNTQVTRLLLDRVTVLAVAGSTDAKAGDPAQRSCWQSTNASPRRWSSGCPAASLSIPCY